MQISLSREQSRKKQKKTTTRANGLKQPQQLLTKFAVCSFVYAAERDLSQCQLLVPLSPPPPHDTNTPRPCSNSLGQQRGAGPIYTRSCSNKQ